MTAENFADQYLLLQMMLYYGIVFAGVIFGGILAIIITNQLRIMT